MSLAIPLSENPEETEIDRLLFELGIELPAIENIAGNGPAAGDPGWPSIADPNENLRDEAGTDDLWSSQPLRMSRPQDMES